MDNRIFFYFISICLCLGITFPSSARAKGLTPAQLNRLNVCRAIIQEVHDKSLEDDVYDLQNSGFLEERLQIFEAVTWVYQDLIQDYALDDLASRKRLYSKIQLNMAYLQLGGVHNSSSVQGALNKIIKRKLIEYLPPELFDTRGLFS